MGAVLGGYFLNGSSVVRRSVKEYVYFGYVSVSELWFIGESQCAIY